jgi:hypothetical protein
MATSTFKTFKAGVLHQKNPVFEIAAEPTPWGIDCSHLKNRVSAVCEKPGSVQIGF